MEIEEKHLGRLMQTVIGFIILVLFSLFFIFAIRWRRNEVAKIYDELKEKQHSYTLIVKTNEEGIQSADSLIINVDSSAKNFEESDFTPELFKVTMTIGSNYGKRTVTKAYKSDIDGNPLSEDDADFTHIVLELTPLSEEEFQTFNSVTEVAYKICHTKINGNILVSNDPIYLK